MNGRNWCEKEKRATCAKNYRKHEKEKRWKDSRWISSLVNKFVAKQFTGKRGCLHRISQAFLLLTYITCNIENFIKSRRIKLL